MILSSVNIKNDMGSVERKTGKAFVFEEQDDGSGSGSDSQ
jgi:hypothetical protein